MSPQDKSAGDPRGVNYWTPERLINAIPHDTPATNASLRRGLDAVQAAGPAGQPGVLSDPAPASSTAPKSSLAPLTVTNWSHTNGKVFFHNTVDGKDYACSGSAVNSSSKRLVITAGHCVYENGAWHTNWVFIPAYNNGSMPYGMFPAYQMRTFTDWINNGASPLGYNSDVAFVTTFTASTGFSVVNAVGGHGLTYNNASGLGYVNSVTSNGPLDNSYLNGPYFDSRMSTLYANSNNDW